MTGALHEGLSPAPPARRPLAGTQTGPARWVLALAVFSAVMGAALGLRGVLLDFSWLLQAAVVVGGTLIIPALLRRYPLLGPFACILSRDRVAGCYSHTGDAPGCAGAGFRGLNGDHVQQHAGPIGAAHVLFDLCRVGLCSTAD